ncbi:MAG: hypothetical protein Q4D79_07700 [Propionibacteriaceae bacterium]|nr:hypothetical protein [Propionibacteriaceae bacterium]
MSTAVRTNPPVSIHDVGDRHPHPVGPAAPAVPDDLDGVGMPGPDQKTGIGPHRMPMPTPPMREAAPTLSSQRLLGAGDDVVLGGLAHDG